MRISDWSSDVCSSDLIPVIAVLDTNTDPSNIAFPVPANDDASRAIRLYCDAVADAVLAGRQGGAAARGEDLGARDEPPAEEDVAGAAAELPAFGNTGERRRGCQPGWRHLLCTRTGRRYR